MLCYLLPLFTLSLSPSLSPSPYLPPSLPLSPPLLLLSLVTLFSLMVVNNWYVIMVSSYSKPQYLSVILYAYNIIIIIHFLQEGFASQVEADWLVRIYFMCFIIITLVVLQVVISFIVEAFVFKIQAREKGRECHKHHKSLYLCGCKEGRCMIILFNRKPLILLRL